MNCDYYILNKAYLASSPSSSVVESWIPQTYNMNNLKAYNYKLQLRPNNKIDPSLQADLDKLNKDYSNTGGVNFKDGTFTTSTSNPIYIPMFSKENVPVNSQIFISRPKYAIPHYDGAIGTTSGYDYSKRHQWFDYSLLVLDTNGNTRNEMDTGKVFKRNSSDLIYLKFENRAIPIPNNTTYKNNKL